MGREDMEFQPWISGGPHEPVRHEPVRFVSVREDVWNDMNSNQKKVKRHLEAWVKSNLDQAAKN